MRKLLQRFILATVVSAVALLLSGSAARPVHAEDTITYTLDYNSTDRYGGDGGLFRLIRDINKDDSGAEHYIIKLASDTYATGEPYIEKNITLLGCGYTLTLSKDSQLIIRGSGTLNLGVPQPEGNENELILTAESEQKLSESDPAYGHDRTCISIDDFTGAPGGELNMYEGTILEGTEVYPWVTAYAVNVGTGTFNMYGGEIRNFSGHDKWGEGAVVLIETTVGRTGQTPTFNMYGGSIHDNVTVVSQNSSHTLSGAVTVHGGVFNMMGGSIVNNVIRSEDGNTFHTYGAGVTGNSDSCVRDLDSDEIIPGTIAFEGRDGDTGGTSVINLQAGIISGNDAGPNGSGGGVFVNSDTTLTVASGFVIENNKAKFGGGIFNNSEHPITVSEGAVLVNNTALEAGADLYQQGDTSKTEVTASATLPDAAAMNKVFLADGMNQTITGWYKDEAGARWTAESAVSADASITGTAALVAAYRSTGMMGSSLFHVTYKFVSKDGTSLPADVLNLLPQDTAEYAAGEVVSAVMPAKLSVASGNDTWTFEGYDSSSLTLNSDGVFTGTWKRTAGTTGTGNSGSTPKPSKPSSAPSAPRTVVNTAAA